MSSKKKPFSWPQIAVLLIAAGVMMFNGVRLTTAWPAMLTVPSQVPSGESSLPGLVLLFGPQAVVTLMSAAAFTWLLITRSTLLAQVYLVGLFLLYSLATGLIWYFLGHVGWLDLAWLMLLVALFFALGYQERTQCTKTEQMHVNG